MRSVALHDWRHRDTPTVADLLCIRQVASLLSTAQDFCSWALSVTVLEFLWSSAKAFGSLVTGQ